MTNKMTKKDYFNTLLTIADVKANESLVKFIENELELLAKKNGGNRKPTAVQKANEEISEKYVNYLCGFDEKHQYRHNEIEAIYDLI